MPWVPGVSFGQEGSLRRNQGVGMAEREIGKPVSAQDTDTASIWFLPGCVRRGNHRDHEGTEK